MKVFFVTVNMVVRWSSTLESLNLGAGDGYSAVLLLYIIASKLSYLAPRIAFFTTSTVYLEGKNRS